MPSNDIVVRKQIFELIESLYSNKQEFSLLNIFSLFKHKKPLEKNNLFYLIDLLTNRNPYIALPEVNLQYKDFIKFLDTETSSDAQYSSTDNTITFRSDILSEALNNPNTLSRIITIIGHEQRHHLQNIQKIEDLKYIEDIKRELYSGNLSNQDLKEIANFINDNNAYSFVNEEEIKTYQFGAYLSNACEIDARKYEMQFTNSMFEHIINDELCPKKLKNKLLKSLETYNTTANTEIAYFNNEMEKFASLRKRLKNTFIKLLERNNEKLSEERYLNLLQKVMMHISKEMTSDEKVKFIEWTIDNNYTYLIHQISFDSKGGDKTAISNYLNHIINNSSKVKFNNIRNIFTIHSIQFTDVNERIQKNSELIVKLINDNQIQHIQSIVMCLSRENVNTELIAKNFIIFANNKINDKSTSIKLFLTIKNLAYFLIYSVDNNFLIEEMKDITEEISQKLHLSKPKDLKDEIGELLRKIRNEVDETTV